MKPKILKSLPLMVAVALVLWVTTRTDWRSVVDVLRSTNLPLFFSAFALMYSQFLLTTVRWNLLLRNRGISLSFGTLFRTYLAGAFISSFLPSRYSGDVYRGWVVARASGQTYESAASVVLERASGLFVLCGTGLVASVYWTWQTEHDFFIPIAASMAAIIGLILSMFSVTVIGLVTGALRMAKLTFLISPVMKFHKAIVGYRGQKSLLGFVVGLSFVFYLQAFLIIFLLLRSVGIESPYTYVAVVIPVVYLLEAMPISINGLGLREGAFFFFFSRVGVPNELILAFAVLVLLNRSLTNLSGGIFLAFGPSDWKAARRQKTKTLEVTA